MGLAGSRAFVPLQVSRGRWTTFGTRAGPDQPYRKSIGALDAGVLLERVFLV